LKGFSFPKNELSAVPPEQYADRFVKFIRENVRTKDEPRLTREDISRAVIAEESPMVTPVMTESPRPVLTAEPDVIESVIDVQNVPGETEVPSIMIQHPSPVQQESKFEKELVNGIPKPGLTNGIHEDQPEKALVNGIIAEA
jgi:hypothetical protein